MQRPLTRNITIKQLRLMSVLGRELSIRRSAEILHTSQPALSRALSQLEEMVGAKLFDRTTRQMTLTSAGQSLLRHADRILTQLEQAQTELAGLKEGIRGEVRIGTIPAFSSYVLGRALDQARSILPGVSFTIQTAETDRLFRDLADGNIDIMLSHAEFSSDLNIADIHELYQERSCIVCDPAHPLASSTKLHVSDIASWPWILTPPETALRKVLNRTVFVDRPSIKHDLTDIQVDAYPQALGILQNSLMLMALPNQYALVYERLGMIKRLHLPVNLLRGPMCCFTLKAAKLDHSCQVLLNSLRDAAVSVVCD